MTIVRPLGRHSHALLGGAGLSLVQCKQQFRTLLVHRLLPARGAQEAVRWDHLWESTKEVCMCLRPWVGEHRLTRVCVDAGSSASAAVCSCQVCEHMWQSGGVQGVQAECCHWLRLRELTGSRRALRSVTLAWPHSSPAASHRRGRAHTGVLCQERTWDACSACTPSSYTSDLEPTHPIPVVLSCRA